jgi:F0F1-type ATP synthase delta subunit
MEKIFQDFAKKIKTTEEMAIFLDEISKIQKIVFEEKEIALIERLRGKVSKEFEKFFEKLEKENLIPSDPEGQFLFFEKLKKYLRGLPKIKLEIAFLPSDEFLNKISQWLEEQFNQKIILDLFFNPKIVGGAIIEFEGKYFNFSVSKEIDKIFEKKL